MKRKDTYKIILLLLLVQTICWAQDDIHFTQYKWVPSFQNPALSGQIEDGNMAYGIIYRDQAFTVTENEYRSLAAHVDSKFLFKNLNSLGLSISIVSDKAGDGVLNSTQIALGTSYEMALNKSRRQFLSIGVQGHIIQRSYGDLGAFILEDQLLTGISTEPLANQSSSYPDANLGISYRNNLSDHSSIEGGFSIHHLNNSTGLNNEEVIDKYDLKYNAFLELRRKLSNTFWLQPKIQHIQSNIFKATQIQTMLEYHPSDKKDYIFYMGLGWRVKDALEFMLGVKYKSWKIGLAYDYNTSGLRAASGNVAGLEIGIRYTHYRPEEKEEIKEEPPAIIKIYEPDTTRLVLIIPDSIPSDSIHIVIIEEGRLQKDITPNSKPYEFDLDPNYSYELIITVPNFIPDTLTIPSEELMDHPTLEKKITLFPIPEKIVEVITPVLEEVDTTTEKIIYKEEPIILDKIFYDFDEDIIIEDSEKELQPLLEIMLEHPDMKIELSSHTDVRGDDDYNMELSHRRAISAKTWLVERGINANRIIAKGYGETRLSNHCENGVYCSEPLHRKNRRTEFKIISGPKSVRYRTDEKN